MEAEREIMSLMHQYCAAIDQGDFKAFGQLFAHAEWLAEGVAPSPEARRNVIIYEDGTPKTKHVLSNIEITLQANNQSASAHSYVSVYQQTNDFPLQVIFVGEYFDQFECVNDRWRFKRRDIRRSLIGNLTAHLRQPGLTIPSAG